MSLKELLEQGRLQPHETSPEEIGNLLELFVQVFGETDADSNRVGHVPILHQNGADV